MAPQRYRRLQDDSSLETAKDKQLGGIPVGISKARRQVNSGLVARNSLKDLTVASNLASLQQNGHDSSIPAEKVHWTSFDVSVLTAYRQAHRLDTPAAFATSYNHIILTRPGIASCSPTMSRPKERQRVTGDELALAVRKDFNAAMTNESETVTKFMYTVQNQGKTFRTKFSPSRAK